MLLHGKRPLERIFFTARKVKKEMIRKHLFIVFILLAAAAFFNPAYSRASLVITPQADSVIVQGAILRLDVLSAGRPPDTVTGTFRGKALPFVNAGGGFYTLLGVDMKTEPGVYPLEIRLLRAGRADELVSRELRVADAGFPVQELTLDPKKVFPDSAAMRRIRRESSLRNDRWSRWAKEAFWSGRFIAPLEGELKRFGNRRVLNGVPRSQHSGVDISAPEGAPVLCPAAGKVILTGEFFFSGGSVYIDHGLGMIGMFFHLSRIDVKDGELVGRGQVIGAVGSTGRATGPHLHWGVRWRNARIDPASLLKLELD
ncbi:MAG: M23 family metallopeptidase [Gemmatimonadota bacterium]|nr:M23 family metallopeptidase [Gemmatimonadota bacterium]